VEQDPANARGHHGAGPRVRAADRLLASLPRSGRRAATADMGASCSARTSTTCPNSRGRRCSPAC
jgi:hypothetical protein